MPSSLRIADLHPAYAAASTEEAMLMANLGAAVYGLVRERLHASWSAVLGTEDTVKADVWRSEGRMAALEEVKAQLAEAEKLSVRLAAAEGTVDALRAGVDAEVTRRLARELEGARKDYDLVKAGEVAGLKEALAKAEGQAAAYSMLVEAHESMKSRIADLEEEVSVHRAAATKSSHVIGKQGEATVWEMIETTVLPEFPYAEAKNMSGVSHAADFHLWVMGPSGKRIKMLIDSKKYKRAVNSDEINKLIADVDADDEAHAGLLISLVSPICTTKQFQIRASDKGKPILYLSFYEIEPEYHTKILCWAVRALVSAVHETKDEVNIDLERTEELLKEISTSLKDVDVMVKSHQKMIETLRGMKNGILQKISDFRGEESSEEASTDGGCVTVLKATGVRCGKPVFNGGEKCRHHTSRKGGADGGGGGGGGPQAI